MHGSMTLPQLGWHEFLTTWSLEPGWLVAVLVVGALYVTARSLAGEQTTVRPWRVASFLTGLALLYVAVASAVDGYAMALAWMHMVLHLTLIMVVPALLVLGHPITVVAELSPAAERVTRSRAVGLVVHPVTGFVVYTLVILGTHLTGFMDSMAMSPALMELEKVLYVVAGFLYLTGLIGNEKVRPDVPYLGRVALLVVGMIPDTLVGLVMLQTDHDLYPMYTSMRPTWALGAVADIQTAGGLMWAGGDGGMMAIAIGLAIAMITSPERRAKITGRFLDKVRSVQLTTERDPHGEAQDTTEGPAAAASTVVDPDSDEALDAYNAMLAKLNQHR